MDGGATVLLLEDDAAMRMVCRVNLELDGYRVVEAESVAEAERLLSAETIGVVVIDLKIDPGDGLQFAAQARADYPDVGVVLISGTPGDSEERLAFADAHYAKPFDISEFVVTVKQLADRAATTARRRAIRARSEIQAKPSRTRRRSP